MYNTEENVTYLTTISKVRLLLALYIGAKKTFVRTKFDVKNASSYVYKFFNLLFQRIREDIELKLQLAYSSFACKSTWVLITPWTFHMMANYFLNIYRTFSPKSIQVGGPISVLANAFLSLYIGILSTTRDEKIKTNAKKILSNCSTFIFGKKPSKNAFFKNTSFMLDEIVFWNMKTQVFYVLLYFSLMNALVLISIE